MITVAIAVINNTMPSKMYETVAQSSPEKLPAASVASINVFMGGRLPVPQHHVAAQTGKERVGG
jgi:hypothetical protein